MARIEQKIIKSLSLDLVRLINIELKSITEQLPLPTLISKDYKAYIIKSDTVPFYAFQVIWGKHE